jgi:N6-adenosine-specific RNA methylase IME4
MANDIDLLRKLPLPFRIEVHENVIRKDFTEEERGIIQREMRRILSPPDRVERKKRKDKGPSISGKDLPLIDDDESPDVAAEIARLFDESAPTLRKRIAVIEAAESDPERFGPLRDAMNRTGKVNGAYKRLKSLLAADSIAAEPPPLPEGPFRVIVVDPPWQYDNRAEDASHRAANPYPSMSLDAIRALDVAGRAHRDCVLWLWTTNAHIPHAFGIVEGWGFEYKTMLTWVKDRMGTGEWLRGRSEHCLLAVRGRPTITLGNQTTVIEGPLREHSRKPDEFYAIVESLCPGARLEMFCRSPRQGWVSHGDEVR